MSTPSDSASLTSSVAAEYDLYSAFNTCGVASNYTIIEGDIGMGQYGVVHKAIKTSQPTGQVYALKTFREKALLYGHGIPWVCMHEYTLMKSLKHENVLEALELVKEDRVTSPFKAIAMSIAMPYCEHDLEGLLKGNYSFSLRHNKNIAQQLLRGLSYLEKQEILHRDVKPSNILFTNSGVLKITDFGISKRIDGKSNSNNVVTLYYRAPEVILGDPDYDAKIDLWSAGCIIAELFRRSVLFRGNSVRDQLRVITSLCGPINPTTYPGVNHLPYYTTFYYEANSGIRQVRERLRRSVGDRKAIDLIDRILVSDPSQRLDVTQSLNHEFFSEAPAPATNQDLAQTLTSTPQSMFHHVMEMGRRYLGFGQQPTEPST